MDIIAIRCLYTGHGNYWDNEERERREAESRNKTDTEKLRSSPLALSSAPRPPHQEVPGNDCMMPRHLDVAAAFSAKQRECGKKNHVFQLSICRAGSLARTSVRASRTPSLVSHHYTLCRHNARIYLTLPSFPIHPEILALLTQQNDNSSNIRLPPIFRPLTTTLRCSCALPRHHPLALPSSNCRNSRP